MYINRRSFLKKAFLGATATGLGGSFLFPRKSFSDLISSSGFMVDNSEASPLLQITDPNLLKDFNGDNFSRAHPILWNKESYIQSKGGIPAPSENVNIVVIGGGMSGLTAAYLLRDLSPIILEQAPQFGGNSKGERWQKSEYSIGAAYINPPVAGTLSESLLKDLGLLPQARFYNPEESPAIFRDQIPGPFWKGATDPARASDFKRIWDAMAQIRENNYPDIPYAESSAITKEQLDQLDQMSFSQWVAKNWGTIHPHIEEFFHEYCWSSFAGAYTEISAAQALNFLSMDLGGLIALPGGNAAITSELYDRLSGALSLDSLRPNAFVVDVSPTSNGVRVCYEMPDGKLKSIQAKTCLVTSAKFIAKVLVTGLPQDQIDAISAMEYRAFVVANLFLKNKIPSETYEIFRLKGSLPGDPNQESKTRGFTDFVFANWASSDQGDASVMTLYRAYPYDGGREELYQNGSFNRVKAEFENDIPEMLKTIQVSPDSIYSLRLTRWGHALPLASTGLIANGTLEKAARPLGQRIFFAQQDNWANPCFETSVHVANEAALSIRKILSAGQMSLSC